MTDALWTSEACGPGDYHVKYPDGDQHTISVDLGFRPHPGVVRSTRPIPSAEALHAMREVCEKAREFVEQQGAIRETLEAFCVNQAAFGYRSHTVELDALGQALDALDAATRREAGDAG